MKPDSKWLTEILGWSRYRGQTTNLTAEDRTRMPSSGDGYSVSDNHYKYTGGLWLLNGAVIDADEQDRTTNVWRVEKALERQAGTELTREDVKPGTVFTYGGYLDEQFVCVLNDERQWVIQERRKPLQGYSTPSTSDPTQRDIWEAYLSAQREAIRAAGAARYEPAGINKGYQGP